MYVPFVICVKQSNMLNANENQNSCMIDEYLFFEC